MKCYILNPKTSGYISQWIDEIVPHVKNMGFDCVHLLPITCMGYTQSPYATINPFEIDPIYDSEYSSENALKEFKRFVKVLKENKIRLCVDLVINHLSIDHPMLEDQPEWLYQDDSELDGIKRAGWYGHGKWHKWGDLALLDYRSNVGGLLWMYMKQYVLFWASFASETDGFIRLDNLHSSDPLFTEFVLLQMNITYPKVKVLSELFSDEAQLKQLCETYNIYYLLGTQWEHKFAKDIKKYIQYIHNSTFKARYFLPVTSHDCGSVKDEFGDKASLFPRMVTSAFLGMGSWGFYQGTEYVLPKKLPFIGPKNPKLFYDIHLNNPDLVYVNFTKKINEVLTSYDTLFVSKGNIFPLYIPNQAILGFVRHQPHKGTNEHALIIINFDYGHEQKINIDSKELTQNNFFFPKKYIDLLSNTEHASFTLNNEGNPNMALTLKPAESFVLYTKL